MVDPLQSDNSHDEKATAILRRLEPVLYDVRAQQSFQREAIADLRGQVRKMLTKTVTAWVIAGIFTAINAVVVAIGLGVTGVFSSGV